METIDEMLLLFGVEEVKSFCKLNAWKYRSRAMFKNGEEDLAKSDWYLRKYKELTETKKTSSSFKDIFNSVTSPKNDNYYGYDAIPLSGKPPING
jgi:hypothetical protein